MQPRSRTGALALNVALATLSIATAAFVIELAFRLAPSVLLPAGTYGAGAPHPDLGMNVHGRAAIYNKVRLLARAPNTEGFLDVEHVRSKPPGVIRIGFFGDSYVESMQVPMEDVFYRRLGTQLGPRVETLGFGISGWGTLHAFKAYRLFAPRYGIDVAVYLFVENDPADNDYECAVMAGETARMPHAELTPDGNGYVLRWVGDPGREPLWHAAAKWAQRESLLANAVIQRVETLRRLGIATRLDRGAVQMSDRAEAIPDGLPATWPRRDVARVERLGEVILKEWKRDADARGIPLLVLYVPRGEDQLRGVIRQARTWYPWLRTTCAALRIPLIDPSEALRRLLDEGTAPYDDHWTPDGHAAIVRVLASALEPVLPDAPSRPTAKARAAATGDDVR